MKRLPHIAVLFAAVLLVAADKKPEKAKEPAPSAAQIQLWVKELGDDDFKVREEASKNLVKAGGTAIDAVTGATKSKDPEVKQRALMIIKLIKQIKKAAIAYFEKLGGYVKIDEKSRGEPVIGLNLGGTKITDAGLVHLKGLTSLRVFSLDFKSTDARPAHLKGLTKLQTLELPGANLTDAGLVHLKGLAKLQELDLHKTKVTDAGLKYLKGAKLQKLILAFTGVTDAGLGHLKGLTKLQVLNLSYTKVTDAGLVHLKGLSELQELSLEGTNVTQAGIENLKKALPNCTIDWDKPPARVLTKKGK